MKTLRIPCGLMVVFLLGMGCRVQNGLIGFGKSMAYTCPIETVDPEKFSELCTTPPAYPVFNEYRGLEGDYHYCYHYAPGTVMKGVKLARIYRTHKSGVTPEHIARWRGESVPSLSRKGMDALAPSEPPASASSIVPPGEFPLTGEPETLDYERRISTSRPEVPPSLFR